ncbi:MAG TPA: hypothetical protein VH595_13450 [Verrucomicrobiae bacterium]|jgi:hypothetical protein|nr:hypothetical protein [Verrucomicrobiae bacterium]
MKNQHLSHGWNQLAAGIGLALACGLGTINARADVEVARRWATAAPNINGTATATDWGTATATSISEGSVNYAQMRTMNDGTYLYVLLDVNAETVNNPVYTPETNGDFYALYIDKDLNYAITPNVDFDYSTCQNGDVFDKSIYLSDNSFTGCQPVAAGSLGSRGFAGSLNTTTPHRIWSFRLSLNELGVDTSTWTTSGGTVPKVRMEVVLDSPNPAFYIGQPDTDVYPDMHLMYQIDLATFPSYPPGTTGPIFAGVGMVPANYIDGSGYANINIADYYSATNAPFGANLNIFGNWNTLRIAYGADRYQVLYSYKGGPYTPLIQTWTNFKWNGATWVPNAIGPDAVNSYPIPEPWELWYLPNLLISWQSGLFGDGNYKFKLQLLNSSGTPLSSPSGNSLTLFVDNTPPTVMINDSYINGTPICQCGLVTPGPCETGRFPLIAYHGFTFNITVNDPNGALNSYSLSYTYGNNNSGSIFSDSYVPSHVGADGPERWDGVTNITEPYPPFCAPAACAYTFTLSASSRVQNGYGLVFPYVNYNNSLTILSPESTESVNCSGATADEKTATEDKETVKNELLRK